MTTSTSRSPRQLRVERPVAKIAVLAAMYGQTSGAAGQALRRMEVTYPRALAALQAAEAAGRSGRPITTYGGRHVPVWTIDPAVADLRSAESGRGRFTRNALIQGAAAELFKAWAAATRLALRETGAQIVLCLHDELLVHAPVETADRSAEIVADDAGIDCAALVSGQCRPVRRGPADRRALVRGQGLTQSSCRAAQARRSRAMTSRIGGTTTPAAAIRRRTLARLVRMPTRPIAHTTYCTDQPAR